VLSAARHVLNEAFCPMNSPADPSGAGVPDDPARRNGPTGAALPSGDPAPVRAKQMKRPWRPGCGEEFFEAEG
jgi:hypothetical protein